MDFSISERDRLISAKIHYQKIVIFTFEIWNNEKKVNTKRVQNTMYSI